MDKTLPQLLSYSIPVVTAIIAACTSYLVSSMSLRRPERRDILEDQYLKVLAPLHRTLFFDSCTEEEQHSEIAAILSNEYCIVPQPIILCWQKEDPAAFAALIRYSFHKIAYKLGYTQVRAKMKRNDVPVSAKAFAACRRTSPNKKR